jgi:hypothetical protein
VVATESADFDISGPQHFNNYEQEQSFYRIVADGLISGGGITVWQSTSIPDVYNVYGIRLWEKSYYFLSPETMERAHGTTAKEPTDRYISFPGVSTFI